MHIDWWTFALQGFNFLILVWLLQRVLYRPAKAIIEKRRALAEKVLAEADEKMHEAEATQKRYEDSLAAAKGERQQMMEQAKKDIEDEHNRLLEQAGKEAQELLTSARTAVGRERDNVMDEVREQVSNTAIRMATELLQHSGATVPADALLERLKTYLAGIPATERDRLRDDLAADGSTLRVVTAASLTADTTDGWRAALLTALKSDAGIDFDTDAALVGGVELHFPHAVLKFSWADQLRTLNKTLREHESDS